MLFFFFKLYKINNLFYKKNGWDNPGSDPLFMMSKDDGTWSFISSKNNFAVLFSSGFVSMKKCCIGLYGVTHTAFLYETLFLLFFFPASIFFFWTLHKMASGTSRSTTFRFFLPSRRSFGYSLGELQSLELINEL